MGKGARAAGAFCSSSEELELLGGMLKSMAGGSAAAATLLKGSVLQVGMVHCLVAIINSPPKVAKLKGCLQGGKAAVATADKGVWLQVWLHFLGGVEPPASLAHQSIFSKALRTWAESNAERAQKQLETARKRLQRAERSQTAQLPDAREKLAAEEEASRKPFELSAHLCAMQGCAPILTLFTSDVDSSSDADPCASPPSEATAPPSPVADAMAAATSLAELATVAAAAPVAELEKEGSAAAVGGEKSPQEQRLRAERERASALCWELRKELEAECAKSERVNPTHPSPGPSPNLIYSHSHSHSHSHIPAPIGL